MKPQPGEIITVESEDGILHEMLVKSVDNSNRTVTGEVSNWEDRRARFSDSPDLPDHTAILKRTVKTITVPERCISWVGHRKLK